MLYNKVGGLIWMYGNSHITEGVCVELFITLVKHMGVHLGCVVQ